MDHIQEFRAAIAAAGLTPPQHIEADGKRHRFSSSGNRGDDAGWYILFNDERPAGAFGCWRNQISATWKSDAPRRQFTAEERAEWQQRMQAIERQRNAERVEAARAAADKAAAMWDRAHAANGHPYLQRKGITGHGARELGELLLIPMRHGPGQLVGLQCIQPSGERVFLKGTPAEGAYHVIGKPSHTGPVVICEGYATGVSIHDAIGWCVVVAFSASNLGPVAHKIRAALPHALLIVAPDDDAYTVRASNHPQSGQPWNPGMEAGIAAAQAVGASLVVPRWSGERAGGTDFNDLHTTEGIAAVRACFEQQVYIEVPADSEPGDKPGSVTDNPGSSDAVASPTAAVAAGQERSVSDPAPPGETDRALSVPRAVDYYKPLPHHSDKGKPLATIGNVEEICRRLGVIVRYNVISKEEEILIPGHGFSLDNRQNASLAWVLSECARFKMPTDKVPDFITYLADGNQYNPVANWITSRPWDGKDHLSELVATVTAKGESESPAVSAMKRAFITRWMISAVAAAFRPHGVSAHGVLVFQGEQYVGKTKWFKSLVPSDLGVLQDGVILRPEDRDSVKQCVSNWLVELGELDATFRKSDIAALKAFLTRDRDVFRRAYARKESEFARRTVFFASVNPKEFLHDPTGNRRYWTIEVEHLDYDHQVDMQQCWAQVYEALYQAGETWFLQPDEMTSLNEHNKSFEVIDPIEELITSGLDWSAPGLRWSWYSATDVLRMLGRDTPSQAEATRAAHVIRARNGRRSKKSNGGRYLMVPPVREH